MVGRVSPGQGVRGRLYHKSLGKVHILYRGGGEGVPNCGV